MGRTIGIMGGYGAVGQHLGKILASTLPSTILIGGRDLEKARTVARQIGPAAEAVFADIDNRASLDDFCCRCDLVINCAGPSRIVLDKVAGAALGSCSHYIDAGGEKPLRTLLATRESLLRDDQLCFLLSAGSYPGLSAVFPAWLAMTCMDMVEEAELYFHFGKSPLSLNAALDIVRGIRDECPDTARYCKNGMIVSERVPPRHVAVPEMGTVYAHPTFMDELISLSGAFHMKTTAYMLPGENLLRALIGVKSALAAQKDSEEKLAQELAAASAEENLPMRTIYYVKMKGARNNEPARLEASLIWTGDAMRLVALVLAHTAGMVLEGHIKPGVAFMAEAVDPVAFMDLMTKELSITCRIYE